MAHINRLSQPVAESAPLPVILAVEADPDTQSLYAMLFPADCYVVEVFDDGAEALGRAICRPPDVILTEARIRRIDGFALCQLLRSDPATRRVPIVMITSTTNNAERARALRAGADALISKPFDVDDLTASVRKFLASGRGDGTERPQEPAVAGAAGDQIQARTARRLSMSRRLQRQWTINPPLTPPQLRCPSCDSALIYEQSHIGGVSERAIEQWDYFACARCGPFQYRHRTRKLKRTV